MFPSLQFSVQLQHHARHQLPTFQLIFVHVIESLVFVPVWQNTSCWKCIAIYFDKFCTICWFFCFDLCRLWLGSSFFCLSSMMTSCSRFLFWLLYGYVSCSRWSGKHITDWLLLWNFHPTILCVSKIVKD